MPLERRRDVILVGVDEDGWALYERGPVYAVEVPDDDAPAESADDDS